jgi:DNA-binding MarR family transcriptional regulator
MYRDTIFIDMTRRLSDEDYRRLLELRTGLRRFLRWSEEQAAAEDVTPAQHQLLLAIRGHADPRGPTIGDVAEHLVLHHHSAVGLVDRAVAAGLVHRSIDADDRRVVRLELTPAGRSVLGRLAERHLDELGRLAGRVGPLLAGFATAPRT